MYRLENPEFLYFLLVVPILWGFYFMYLWWQKKTRKIFADDYLLNKIAPERSSFKSFLKMIFLSLGMASLIIALVNPQLGTALKTVKRSGVDVVFALDVSKSMLAEDVTPSRLEKAKLIIRNVINNMGNDRVGIIIYAGNAYPLLPITSDHAAAKMFLENAHPDLVSSQGTAIAEAINLSLKYFDADEETNRFLFVISDGEDHEENATSSTKIARSQAIKIFSIGIGTLNGGPIPINKMGDTRYKKDQDGNVVITRLNEEILKDIAQIGNGSFIDGNNIKTAVDMIKKILNNADKKDFEAKEFSDYKDQFQWFIGFGLLFLILDLLLLEKKTAWIEKLNLFNENKNE